MNDVANLSVEQRNELFQETASLMNTTNAIVEKDFWVVWTLDKLFSDARLNKVLMFKGGTSLSKVFNLIGRFSEDIDLILDWTLVTGKDPQESRTPTQQGILNKQVNKDAIAYIEEVLLPVVSEILSSYCTCSIDEEDKFSINIIYPSAFIDKALRPQILLEIGPLASWLPSSSYTITPFVAEKFPHLFKQPECSVNAVMAKRTFWEKATILHQEANRAEGKMIPLRHSRHYYDLAQMAQAAVKEEALTDLGLLQDVVEFKQKFYRSPWAKYEDAKVGTFKLLPPAFRYKELKEDYASMQSMIFDKHLTFEEIITLLESLEAEINALEPLDE
ncbi:nucleotidyl transferase AbiEii/AbiGii toxin family protein [Sulfurovum sp.]|uniref:nucleotidyl transferase AbiEii/AbiGii toxin family protein n=1 Tax=Sulfurovum sp. TaxID=1969726 RepID=UPI00356A798C